MAYSRKVHNNAASPLRGYFSRKEIDDVNARMDAGSRIYGPRHQALDPKHPVFMGMKRGGDLPVRVIHGIVDAGAAISLAGEKVTFGAVKRSKIFTQRR